MTSSIIRVDMSFYGFHRLWVDSLDIYPYELQ